MVLPTQRILIVAIEDDGEAHALREVAERFSATVDFVGIGETRDVIETLNASPGLALVVLCSHGKDGAMLMPELEESLASQQPFQGPLTPDHVRRHLKLRGCRLLCTGCSTGVAEMGAAFLDAGCEWFVAPDGYPDGAETFMFTTRFLYLLLHRGMNVGDAVEMARRDDNDRGVFRLYGGSVVTGV